MRRTLSLLVSLGAVALLAGACGGGSDGNASGPEAAGAVRTVVVEMRDIAYKPGTVSAKAGERVRFVFRNTGKVPHDAFVGDERAQAAHEQEMRSMDGMGGMHHSGSDPNAVTVQPGATAELTHTFKTGEQVTIGCHQPGHFAAGMRLPVTVS